MHFIIKLSSLNKLMKVVFCMSKLDKLSVLFSFKNEERNIRKLVKELRMFVIYAYKTV